MRIRGGVRQFQIWQTNFCLRIVRHMSAGEGDMPRTGQSPHGNRGWGCANLQIRQTNYVANTVVCHMSAGTLYTVAWGTGAFKAGQILWCNASCQIC